MERSSEEIPAEKIASNLARARNRIAEAALRQGRKSDSVTLIAVTKYMGLAEIRTLYDLGVRDFGEARIQDAEKKIKELKLTSQNFDGIHWHLIGHLQTNKADKASRLFETVHAVDSLRIAQALNKEREKNKLPPLACFLEVNVAGEANKFGFAPTHSEITEMLKQCSVLSAIQIKGLMCMAPHADAAEATSRPVFRKLNDLMAQANDSGAYPTRLSDLSMGMTQDYDIAIQEGATMVRVGSALFE